MKKRLSGITTKTGNNIFRKYELQYENSDHFSRLNKIILKNGAGGSLKPTTFNWAFLPSLSQSVYTPTVNGTFKDQYPYYPDPSYTVCTSADYDGNGLADLVEIGTFELQGSKYSTILCIHHASLDSQNNVQFSGLPKYVILSNCRMERNWHQQRGGATVVDYLGVGRGNIVIPEFDDGVTTFDGNGYGTTTKVFFTVVVDKNETISPISPGAELQDKSQMPLYAYGDMDNNGKDDIVYLEKGKVDRKYNGKIFRHSLQEKTLALTLTKNPEKMFIADYNGDGMNDILVFYEGGYSIFWNEGDGNFSDSSKTSKTNMANVWNIWSGDFNGDGLADFLMSCSAWGNTWKFAINNGDGTFTQSAACTLDIYDQDFTDRDDDKFSCLIYDMDGDGKSDVIIQKAVYKKFWNMTGYHGEFDKNSTRWMRSTGTALVEISSATSSNALSNENNGLSGRYVLGDFNGDGQPELMNYGYNCYSAANAAADTLWRLYKNPNFSAATGKITAITTGMDNKTMIEYAALTDTNCYTKGMGTYPAVNYTISLYTVKNVKTFT